LLKLKIDVQKAFDILVFIKTMDNEITAFNELKNAKIKEL